MTGSHSLAWWLTFVCTCAGVLIWLGLSLFGFAMIFQGEGSYTSGRQLLADMGLVELFAYYPWLGAAAFVAAAVVVALMLARLLARDRHRAPLAAGPEPQG